MFTPFLTTISKFIASTLLSFGYESFECVIFKHFLGPECAFLTMLSRLVYTVLAWLCTYTLVLCKCISTVTYVPYAGTTYWYASLYINNFQRYPNKVIRKKMTSNLKKYKIGLVPWVIHYTDILYHTIFTSILFGCLYWLSWMLIDIVRNIWNSWK